MGFVVRLVRLLTVVAVLSTAVGLPAGPATAVPQSRSGPVAVTTNDFTVRPVGWAMVLSGYANDTYWGGDGENAAKVGQCPISLDPSCNRIGDARSYFQFDVSALRGKHIINAEFNVFETRAPSCSVRQVEAWNTGAVSSSTTWNNQPFPGGAVHLGTHDVAYGYGASCPANWVGFNATAAVNNALAYSNGLAAIMLKASNEGDDYAWKKFATTPTLLVTYNSYPNTPAEQTTAGKHCAVQPNEPYSDDASPSISAVLSDPDGGLVHGQFEYWDRFGALRGQVITGVQASGTRFTVTVPDGVYTEGSKIAVRVRTADGVDFGPWGQWCDLTIDRTPPDRAPTVTSADYRECGFGGGIGRTGAFTVGANGVADVVGFRFGLDNASTPEYAAAKDGTARLEITPPEDGPMDLYIRSVDRAGNFGPLYTSQCGIGRPGQGGYHFLVGPGTPPVGHWPLNGMNENVARDESYGNHDGPVDQATAVWKRGRVGDALWFNGSTGHVTATNGSVVDTSKTFSIAAWAKLDRVGGWPAVVSQDGNRTAGFQLQATPTGRWALAMFAADVDGGGAAHPRAISEESVQAGVWTHLVGIHDAAAGKLSLYVNGRLAATAAHVGAWRSTGALTIGRSLWTGLQVDHWPGAVDEVRAYDRALSVAEIQGLATTPAVEEVFLPLDDGVGSTAGDVAGSYRNGTLTGPVSWLPAGKVGRSALRFAGNGATGGSVETTATAVRTDRSFTVTAFVRLDEADPDNAPGVPKDVFQTVVSQDGPLSSGLALQYVPTTKKWTLAVSEQDAAGPRWLTVESATEARAGEWTHLAGVHDLAAGQLRLYVNGSPVGSRPAKVVANVEGNVVLGRAKQANAGDKTAYLSGLVDDVHIWTGVRTPDQLRTEYLKPPTSRTTPYGGQLNRYWSTDGYHVVTTGPVPPGQHFEWAMGKLAPAGTAGTRTTYSCRNHATDYFVSGDPNCEGKSVLGAMGALYTSAPPGIPTMALYRCLRTGKGHFVSHHETCEGQVNEGRLGYAAADVALVRSTSIARSDRASSLSALDRDYRPETSLGLVSQISWPGTAALYRCQDGDDHFLSREGDCEGATILGWGGQIRTAASTTGSAELYRCRTAVGDRFESRDPGCEGHTFGHSLGHVLTTS